MEKINTLEIANKLKGLLAQAVKRLNNGEKEIAICLSCYFRDYMKYRGQWVDMSHEILGRNYIVNNEYNKDTNPQCDYLHISKRPSEID